MDQDEPPRPPRPSCAQFPGPHASRRPLSVLTFYNPIVCVALALVAMRVVLDQGFRVPVVPLPTDHPSVDSQLRTKHQHALVVRGAGEALVGPRDQEVIETPPLASFRGWWLSCALLPP